MQYNNFPFSIFHSQLKRAVFFILIAVSTLSADLSRSGDIVSDSTTGLQWQDDAIVASAVRTWTEAIDYCENTLTLGGHTDWRLPNKKELLSIADRSRYNPVIDDTVFANTALDYYRSSTTSTHYSGNAWVVRFSYGYSSHNHVKDSNYCMYVRCVRGGQFGISIIPHISFISEVPQDNILQLDPFTKEWTFGADLAGYSAEVLGSDFSSYDAVSVSGRRCATRSRSAMRSCPPKRNMLPAAKNMAAFAKAWDNSR